MQFEYRAISDISIKKVTALIIQIQRKTLL